MITLKGEDVFSQLKKVSEGQYKSGPQKDATYFVMSHGKRGFTLPADVFGEWQNGNIASLSLEETTYDRENPETNEMETVASLSYSGHITNKQQERVAVQRGKLSAIETKIAETYKIEGSLADAI